MGGDGIKRLHHEDSDLLETFDLIDQKKKMMIQKNSFLEVFEGDKRVILISGKDCGFSRPGFLKEMIFEEILLLEERQK